MKKLQRSEMKNLLGGLYAPGNTICVTCGSMDVTCMAQPQGWTCSHTNYTGISCKNNNESEEYAWQAYCCAGASGCTSSTHPYDY